MLAQRTLRGRLRRNHAIEAEAVLHSRKRLQLLDEEIEEVAASRTETVRRKDVAAGEGIALKDVRPFSTDVAAVRVHAGTVPSGSCCQKVSCVVECAERRRDPEGRTVSAER
jgi:hypothetical protein